MNSLVNKLVAIVFFISSGIMFLLSFTTYDKIANAYGNMPETVKTAAKMQNFPLEEIFSALRTSGFGLFFIGGAVLFGFGWIILNFALQKNNNGLI